MKTTLLAVTTLLLSGCISAPPPPVIRTIYVPADVRAVYIVRESPVYYPPVRWNIGIGFGHRHGPWRR